MAAALVASATRLTIIDDDECFAAVNLLKEWKDCCYHAMGMYDWYDTDDDDEDAGFADARNKETIDSVASLGHIMSGAGGSSFRVSRYPAIHIVNLVPELAPFSAEEKDDEGEEDEAMVIGGSSRVPVDPWLETALQIDQNISQMRDWIQKKKLDYISVIMSEEEAGLIQSTVTSFTATTANEIESLRQMIKTGGNQNRHHHLMGIIQILLASLQESVAQPFGKLQKQRSRSAVKIWQNPLECRLTPPFMMKKQESSDKGEDSRLDSMLGLTASSKNKKGPEQHFLPHRPAHRLQANVWESYQLSLLRRGPEPERLQRPTSILFRKKREKDESMLSSLDGGQDASGGVSKRIKSEGAQLRQRVTGPPKPLAAPTATPKKVLPPRNNNNSRAGAHLMDGNNNKHNNNDCLFYTNSDQLDREAAQLMLAVRNDLDSVQQMEERMVDIMTLLGHFASLVSEQQQEVQQIHSSTADAKQNVDKGQENLVEAKERTESGPNYKATVIIVMSCLLLFFHWLRP